MPIYSYRCQRCDRVLELLHDKEDWRTLCSADCPQEVQPGMGELKRMISLPGAAPKSGISPGGLDVERAGKKGFSVYKRQGDGTYDRVAGSKGPGHLTASAARRLADFAAKKKQGG